MNPLAATQQHGAAAGPSLSVVIANHNYAEYLRQAIDSALALDWPHVQVIVIDDGSTDHSRSVIESYGERIVALFQEQAGQRAATNVALERAAGEVILFLDADDVLIAFATQADGLAAVIDGGRVLGGTPSTVLDLSVTPARVLRPGPVTRAMLAEVVDVAPAPID